MRWSEINLVNWREQQFTRGVTHWFVVSVAALLVIITVYFSTRIPLNRQAVQAQTELSQLQTRLNQQQSRLTLMSDLQKRYLALEERERITRKVMTLRTQWWRFLQMIPSSMARGVYLQKLEYRDYGVHGYGLAKSRSDITQTLSLLESSPMTTKVRLHTVTHGALWFDEEYLRFDFSIMLDPSNAAPALLSQRL